MYILMISRGVPTKHDPQWGCFEKDQAESLVSIGHKVVVMSIDSRFRLKLRKIGTKYYNINNVHYYDYHLIPGIVLRYFGKKIRQACIRWQVKHLFKKIQFNEGVPEIIYGQFFFNTALGAILKENYRIPLVGIEHAARFNNNQLDSRTYETAKYAYNNTDAIITVSNSLRERIKYHFGKDSTVVHNTASSDFFNLQIHSVEKCNHYVMVATGSLIYRKGFDLLIKALAQLKIPSNIWSLKIIGEGPERKNLQNLIDLLGLTNNIELLGQLTRNNIAKVLSDSDIFILPSRSENFSVAIIEALACGLPVITSDCGGSAECINDSNGILFQAENIDALAESIMKVLSQYNRYDRKKIAADCYRNYSSQATAKQLEAVFTNVIDNRNSHVEKEN